MQIDDRAFPQFTSTGKWKDPRENILFGCKVLADNRAFMQRKTNFARQRAYLCRFKCIQLLDLEMR
jgi:hypothetical protein